MTQEKLKGHLNSICGLSYIITEVLFYTHEKSQLIIVVYLFDGFNKRVEARTFTKIQDAINNFDASDRLKMTKGLEADSAQAQISLD